eukprot:TRINITY_DN62820_c0_g1_i1.p1 TRINITY_DN62820_c0_g1~~TRINITY_DN62820_c0_g1_i1.p1  ORF type:complete len:546 (-),score=139.23 TRINITY_DN62820_c0_g1_i1:226-1863(-)
MGACGSNGCRSRPGDCSPTSMPAQRRRRCGEEDMFVGRRASNGSQVSGGSCGIISRELFILENPKYLRDVYDIQPGRVLGQGSYGSVRKVVHRVTGEVRAVKTVMKTKAEKLTRLQREIAIMKRLDHPNIVNLIETFEDAKAVHLAMELCQGGELFERIIEAKCFTEAQAAVVMQQILRSVYYMHENGICHRDIKPENFLFLTKDPIERNVLKVIDFGLSCKACSNMTTKAGTPFYVAPQVLRGNYSESCDLWSCGVIMYTLLCGYPPFHGKTDGEVLSKVRKGNYEFEAKHWRGVSEDAKMLIRNLLAFNQEDRYSADEALRHTWIIDKAPRAGTVALADSFVENLQGFHKHGKLKKAALNIIAGRLKEGQVKRLREAFHAFDRNGDGLLTLEELRQGLQDGGFTELPEGAEEQIMEAVDANQSGLIDYTEFIAAGMDRGLHLTEDACYAAFRVFDIDGDGRITKDELRTLFSGGAEGECTPGTSQALADQVAETLRDADTDGDGTVSFDEFLSLLRRSTSNLNALSPSTAAQTPQRAARRAGA